MKRMFLTVCLVTLPLTTARPGETSATSGDAESTRTVIAATMNNRFAVTLYHQLAQANAGQNLFFSPYSMSSALLMTAEGARGETALEMGQALSFPEELRAADSARPWTMEPLHAGMAALNAKFENGQGDEETGPETQIRAEIEKLRAELAESNEATRRMQEERDWEGAATESARGSDLADRLSALLAQVDRYEIRVGNALWAEASCPLNPEYAQTIDRFYGTGGVFPADFRGDAETARMTINSWVEERTRERIRDLIPRGALDALTRLVLTNAIYFKGEWAEPFEERNTKEQDFKLADGGTVVAALMNARGLESARYAAFNADGSFFDTPMSIPADRRDAAGLATYPDENGFAMLELPYKGEALAMIVIAPNRADGLATIEKQFDAETLRRWQDQLVPREVHVLLPKFKLETGYEMTAPLRALGMERAFLSPTSSQGAEFTGMTTSAELFISKVIHRAFVEVNEKGTEAAAATAVVMTATSMPVTVPFTPTFEGDRPFVFFILDKPSGSVLFAGRLMQPVA